MKWKTLFPVLAIGSLVLVAPQPSYADEAEEAAKKCMRIAAGWILFGGTTVALGCAAGYLIEKSKSEDDNAEPASKISGHVARDVDPPRTGSQSKTHQSKTHQSKKHAAGARAVKNPQHGVALRFTPVVQGKPPAKPALLADGLLERGAAMSSLNGPAPAGTPAGPGTAGRVR